MLAATALTWRALSADPVVAGGMPPLRVVANDTYFLNGDGRRYVVFGPRRARSVSVIDTWRGRRYRLRVPRHCSFSAGYGIDYGRAILTCSVDRRTYTNRLLDLRTRRSIRLPAYFTVSGRSEGVRWGTAGRRWVQGDTGCGRYTCRALLNWRTGERHIARGNEGDTRSAQEIDPTLGIELDPATGVDLNGRRPRSRWPCAPYQHVPVLTGERSYERPYLLTGDRRGRIYQLVLARCGGRKRVLDGGPDGVDSVSLSAGIVTWERDGRAFAYDVRKRRRYRWRVPGYSPDDDRFISTEVTHTRQAVFVARTLAYGDFNEPVRIRIYQAPLRR